MAWRRALRVAGALTVVAGGCGGDEAADDAPDPMPEESLVTDDEPVGPLALIPLPAKVTPGDGHLYLPADATISSDAESTDVAHLLAESMSSALGPLRIVASNGDIDVTVDDGLVDLGDEGYRVQVDADGVRITSAGAAGLFYGGQTLRQLALGDPEAPVDGATTEHGPPAGRRLPMVTIEDHPRFEWRGIMVDVSRHFFGADVVKRQIDLVSHYKINRLHLHLTDDQGWRIEMESWPELTAVGASIDIDEGPGGFYTADDFAEIVDYAAARFITVVPEIDLPGHVNAALASYPELNESGTATDLTGVVPFGQSALSLDATATPGFIADVISEMAGMTPGPFLHIGGDEALALDEDEYHELVDLAVTAARRAGKTVVGWEEAGAAGLGEASITQHWLDPAKARLAATKGSLVIASPAAHAYLDMKYSEETPIGLNWAGYVDVDTAYGWDPVADGFTEEQVIGVEGPLWTETVATEDDLELLVYPRILGLAEIGWSPRSGRSWDDYRGRLARHGPALTDAGVGFHRSSQVDWAPA